MKRSLVVASITLIAGNFTSLAHASDYGCQVLLCLSNPAGPMAVTECVPPIQKLWKDLARGRGFPKCSLVSSGGTSGAPGLDASAAYAEPVATQYPDCPDGTSPVEQGAVVVSGSIKHTADNDEIVTSGSPGVSQPNDCNGEADCNSNYNGGMRACVGNYVGDSGGASVFSRVVWQRPSAPNTIRVVIDGRLHQNVSW